MKLSNLQVLGIVLASLVALRCADQSSLYGQDTVDPSVATSVDEEPENGLSPAEAQASFKAPDDVKVECVLHEPEIAQPIFVNFDERGRMWVVEYLQYPDPAGLKEISRDSVWRTVYDKVPPPPPKHFVGADRITIHEDTNSDGEFDKHKTFVDGLNIITSCVQGRGGVWVLNPPYLLFYPDKNRDDVPDDQPEVHLSGFGLEDTHSVVNSLCWGPDGWLYGCQGSTVTGSVIRPGLDEQPIHSQGQAIWRYHPDSRRYEIFAEGGGNAFGLEIDSRGRIYSGTNGGDARGFHYVQGGYFQKGFDKHGPLSNPYSFGYFPAMAHHASQRFTHAFVIYEANELPNAYRGQLLGVAPILHHVVMSDLSPDGSTFRTHDVGHLLTSDDDCFLPVDIKVGPDGAIYVVDMYESHASHRDHHIGQIDRASGRIYRLSSKEAGPAQPVGDLTAKSTPELVGLLGHPNKWHRQTALRLLGDRKDTSCMPQLRALLRNDKEQQSLEALWAIHICGGFDDHVANVALSHSNPYVQLWTSRLLCDDNHVSDQLAGRLADIAAQEQNVEVRSQLACSARRLPASQALRIVRCLLRHDQDVDDVHVPMLLWWAIESKITENPPSVLELFESPDVWKLPLAQKFITERLMRRFAATGNRDDLLLCARLLKMAPNRDEVKRLLAGFETATAGRALAGMPEELAAALAEFGGQSVVLGLRQDRADAVAEALRTIADPQADKSKQLTYVQILGEVNQPQCVPVLIQLVQNTSDGALQSAALSTLARYDDAKIVEVALALYNRLTDDVRSSAHLLLAGRKDWTLRFLEAIDAGSIDAGTVPIDVVQHMRQHSDERIATLLHKHWGELKQQTAAEVEAEINRAAVAINSGQGVPKTGKQLFGETCAKCHALFGEGGRVGPDLTSFKRDDLRQMLVSILHPNAEIREGYNNYTAVTADGLTITGLVVYEDSNSVVLRGNDGKDVPLARDQIDDLHSSPVSLMPEGLLQHFSDQQIRDLFAYLRSTQPLID